MLSIKLICVGKLRERYFTEAAREYEKRLGRYCKLEVEEVAEHTTPDQPSDAQIEAALSEESADIILKLPKNTFTVALCVEGKTLDSPGLAALLEKLASSGRSQVAFIIGGSWGLHGSVKDRADFKLSMSEMTFPRQLARIMLLEQIYRAFGISEGSKYHK